MGVARWFRLTVGLALAVAALWVLFGRLDAIWNGHPAYPTTLLLTVAIGLTVTAFALWPWRREPEPDGPPWEADEAAAAGTKPAARRAGPWRIAGRVVIAIVTVGWLGILAWLQPFPAGPAAMAALTSDATVTVVDTTTTIELVPTTPRTPTVGLVFSPGARVDSRAYAAVLRPAAEAGYLVVILKEPFGMAITQTGQSAGPIADHPEVEYWVVGGHSLGGVVAAWFAADHLPADSAATGAVDGLLLYASYPDDDMSGDVTLQVESVFGTNDGLTTPADIERSRTMLPADTTFTEIVGGVHAFFGDYGEQPGDGRPDIDRATATAEISAATTDFLGRVADH